MSTAAAASAPSDHGLEESKFQIYVQIAMLLAVITGMEIVTVYLPFAAWLLVTALVGPHVRDSAKSDKQPAGRAVADKQVQAMQPRFRRS